MDSLFNTPWGAWDFHSGAWQPNNKLILPPEKQHEENMANGYSCKHKFKPSMCPICKGGLDV